MINMARFLVDVTLIISGIIVLHVSIILYHFVKSSAQGRYLVLRNRGFSFKAVFLTLLDKIGRYPISVKISNDIQFNDFLEFS